MSTSEIVLSASLATVSIMITLFKIRDDLIKEVEADNKEQDNRTAELERKYYALEGKVAINAKDIARFVGYMHTYTKINNDEPT